ncbi:MAG: hypothetical protein WB679_24935 [Terracidiphilus sp.]
MEAKKYTIQNQARDTAVCTGVTAINSTLEPLAALRVMVEGLESDNKAGLWLTHVTVIPMVPRISPFDLVYLDKEDRVVERVELLPASEIPRFKKPSASALVLPFRTISSAKIEPGDQLAFSEIPQEEVQAADKTENENEPSASAVADDPVPVYLAKVQPVKQAPFTIEAAVEAETAHAEAAAEDETATVASLFAVGDPVAHDEDAESPAEVQSPVAEVVTPIFGSWFRMEREAEQQRQPRLEQQPIPIEASESKVGAEENAIVPLPDEPRQMVHWTKFTGAPESSVAETSGLSSTETPHIQEAPFFAPVEPAPEDFPIGPKTDPVSAVPPKNSHVIHLEPARPRLEEVSVSSDLQEKKPIVDRFFRWLYPSLYDQNRRGAERRPSPGLVAYELSGNTTQMHEVDNISSTGIYLRTSGRWEPGARVSLTLQRNGPPEENPQQRIAFEAGAVRAGDDGVGLTFVLPEGMDLRLWESPERTGIYEAEPDSVVRELRMARALAFLRRICPPAGEEIKEMLHKSLSSVRVANAVEISFKAERLLVNQPNAYSMVAHPDLMVRILEHGTWVDMEWIQELWAGLLASSCTFEGQDESNLVFINLLSRMAPLPTQILTAACAKATQAIAESASVSPYLLAFSAEEMAKITRSNNLAKIYRSIAELSELGLLEKGPRISSSANPDTGKAKPTHLGLQMYARCQGIRGAA